MKKGFVDGDIVVFKSRMYKAPNTPFYNSYKGHEFMVSKVKGDDEHLRLVCVDEPVIQVMGHVAPEDLKLAYASEDVARKVKVDFVTGWVEKMLGVSRKVVVEPLEAERMGVRSDGMRSELHKRGIGVMILIPFNYVVFERRN